MTSKQKLIMFLISIDGLNNQYQLVKYLDRADFPSELGKNLDPLLEDELIYVSGLANNGTPFIYGLTDKGKETLSENNFRTEVLNYVKTMNNPNFLLKLVETLFAKENN